MTPSLTARSRSCAPAPTAALRLRAAAADTPSWPHSPCASASSSRTDRSRPFHLPVHSLPHCPIRFLLHPLDNCHCYRNGSAAAALSLSQCVRFVAATLTDSAIGRASVVAQQAATVCGTALAHCLDTVQSPSLCWKDDRQLKAVVEESGSSDSACTLCK